MLTETNVLLERLYRANTELVSYTQPLSGGRLSTINARGPEFMIKYNRALQSFVVDDDHSCLGAQSVFKTGNYRFGVYPALSDEQATPALYHDLLSYLEEVPDMHPVFNSFLAIFKKPLDVTEKKFEELLWKQLQQLHEIDKEHYDWDPEVSKDPQDTNFSYSLGGKAFYIVGMHPNSSRMSRSFPFPMLVFNLHSQFEQLRESEKYERLKSKVRERELGRQGSVNPMLKDFGQGHEASQYSGRAVSKNWKCPFHNAD